MASIAPQAAALPARIGTRYTVLEQLGRGGTAVVYRVRDEGRNDEVALKQLTAVEDPDRRRKLNALFEREYYVLAQLSHPSIVQAYDFGLDPAGPFYTMELLEGGVPRDRAPLAHRECCELGVQVCSALSLIHSRRFVHRDISPRNIHWTLSGHSKLIDFGALMPMGPSRQLVGTPPFTSPEAVHGLALDARSDLFSLGATLYFLLTGRTPFVARTFEDLQLAWADAPVPPSAVMPDIPPELDALVLGLLRIDPTHRPRSAFEVMQRLAAVAGISVFEEAAVSQAYLSTPTLVGRDAALQQFDAAARRATQGKGGALSAEGAAGSGRSRLLDAWVLAARTLGFGVTRSAGNGALRPFTTAYDLALQLTAALPEACVDAAKRDGVFDTLFDGAEGRPQLKALASLAEVRDRLSKTLAMFIEGVSRDRAVLIAVDDAERVDESSLALLAALASRSAERRLLIAISRSTDVAAGTQFALDVLVGQCDRVPLRALSREQTESLFSSVFGQVPNVAIVSDRISTIALGNPGASMAVAQHMVDDGLIRFVHGHWHLPAELTLTDLPADAKQVLRARVANLPPLARRFAELQALAIMGQFGRADYAEFAGAQHAGQVDAALDALVQRGVLTSTGDAFTLAQGDRVLLLSDIPQERAVEHHRALAAHFAKNGPPIAEVHHWLLGGAGERAFESIASLVTLHDERTDIDLRFEISGSDLSAILEEAFRVGRNLHRRPRELQDLARTLVVLSAITDNKLHALYAKYSYDQLAIDSGLNDYHQMDPSLPASQRLQRAIEAAVARYAATPERDRVYRVDEAIKFLARHVSIQIAIGARTRNPELLHANAQVLEPFAPLSPLLAALWQNAIAAYEMNVAGLSEIARERVVRIYEQLGSVKGSDEQYSEVIRGAVAAAVAFIDSALGRPTAEQWIATIEGDPLQVVNAQYLRRIACIVEGDTVRAEFFRTRAEVTALQSSMRQIFLPPLRHELTAQIRCGDLAGVKQVADQMARLAEGAPGWVPLRYVAEGHYQRMRGDLAAAQAAFEHAMAACKAGRAPEHTDYLAWAWAVAGCVGTLVARGQAAAACVLGREALAECEARGMRGTTWDLVRELAVAEAKSGEHDSAKARLDGLIAARDGLLPAYRVVDYEAGVRIALEAKDHDAATRYIELLAEHSRTHGGFVAQMRHVQLSDEARRTGFAVAPADTTQHTIVSPRSALRRQLAQKRVADALAQPDAASRAQKGLALLLDASGGASSGQLYLAQESGLYLAASHGVRPDATLEATARAYWKHLEESEVATSTQTLTHTGDVSRADVCVASDGTKFHPVLLHAAGADGPSRVGLALLAANEQQPLALDVREMATLLSTRLVELGDAQAVALD